MGWDLINGILGVAAIIAVAWLFATYEQNNERMK